MSQTAQAAIIAKVGTVKEALDPLFEVLKRVEASDEEKAAAKARIIAITGEPRFTSVAKSKGVVDRAITGKAVSKKQLEKLQKEFKHRKLEEKGKKESMSAHLTQKKKKKKKN